MTDDLLPYAGEWVILRTGRVVAHDVDAGRLLAEHEPKEGDAVLLVTEPSEDIYLL